MELTWEHYGAMIFYDFKLGLDQEEWLQRLLLAYEDKAPSLATVFRWFTKFCKDRREGSLGW